MEQRSDPARVITCAMQKGGVGKTTSVVCLARAMALLGQRVLVVDLDPQGNATDALAESDLPESSVSIADALLPEGTIAETERVTLGEVLVPTIWPGVDLAPVTSGEALVKAERLIQASDAGRELRLREALEPLVYDYDAVLIDNAPSLGLLLGNALAAGDDERVVVVMEADRWSTAGLARLRQTIQRAQRYSNRSLSWGGVLLSRWRGTRDEKNKLADIAEHFPEAEVWGSADDPSKCIPLRVAVKTAINEGTALDQHRDASVRVISETYEWAARRLLEGRLDA